MATRISHHNLWVKSRGTNRRREHHRSASQQVDLARRFFRFTLQGANTSPTKALLKMIFIFPSWDMLVSWRVALLLLHH